MASVSWGTHLHICFNKNPFSERLLCRISICLAGIISQKHKKDLFSVFLSPFPPLTLQFRCSVFLLFFQLTQPAQLCDDILSLISSMLALDHPPSPAAPMGAASPHSGCCHLFSQELSLMISCSGFGSVLTFSPSYPCWFFAGKKQLTHRIQTTGCWRMWCLS